MTSAASPAYSNLRMEMVNGQLRARGIRDPRVLDAMARVPRHEFTPEPYRAQAYEDHPLPIAEEQTISQPYIVAIMLEALALKHSDKLLEIGTGSGYVTALLAELAAQVVSMERHGSLAAGARELLSAMGYQNVRVITGDGSAGFAECAPYDKIIALPGGSHASTPLKDVRSRVTDHVRAAQNGGRFMV